MRAIALMLVYTPLALSLAAFELLVHEQQVHRARLLHVQAAVRLKLELARSQLQCASGDAMGAVPSARWALELMVDESTLSAIQLNL